MPGPPQWYCQSAPGMGCPTLIPNEGTACTTAGQTCNYPSESCGITAKCVGGAWQWTQDPCPG
jgi:hypothetical protein